MFGLTHFPKPEAPAPLLRRVTKEGEGSSGHPIESYNLKPNENLREIMAKKITEKPVLKRTDDWTERSDKIPEKPLPEHKN